MWERRRDAMRESMEDKNLEKKNELGDIIFDFSLAFDLAIVNTCFKKRDGHLITYESGTSRR